MYLCWQNRIRLFGFKRLQLLEIKKCNWFTSGVIVLLIVCAGDNKHLFLAGADVGILSLFWECVASSSSFFFLQSSFTAVWETAGCSVKSAESLYLLGPMYISNSQAFILNYSVVLWCPWDLDIRWNYSSVKRKRSRIFHFTSKWSHKHISQLILLTYWGNKCLICHISN